MIRLQLYEKVRAYDRDGRAHSQAGTIWVSKGMMVFRDQDAYFHARTEYRALFGHHDEERSNENINVYTRFGWIYFVDGKLDPMKLNDMIGFRGIGHFWLIDLPQKRQLDWISTIQYTGRDINNWTVVEYD